MSTFSSSNSLSRSTTSSSPIDTNFTPLTDNNTTSINTSSTINTSSSNQVNLPDSSSSDTNVKPSQIKLVDVEVKDEVTALNLIVSFLNLAQRRGVFSLDESSKLWECIKMFQKPV
jgi:hypothetical protein